MERLLLKTCVATAVLSVGLSAFANETPRPRVRDAGIVVGGLAMLEAMRAAGVRRIVFSSSAAVYGTPESTPIPEDAPLRPINPYGDTKRAFRIELGEETAPQQRDAHRSEIVRTHRVVIGTGRHLVACPAFDPEAPSEAATPVGIAKWHGAGRSRRLHAGQSRNSLDQSRIKGGLLIFFGILLLR